MGWVTIELTKWERVISPCMGGTSMLGLIVVLVGTMSAPICTSIAPMPWELIVGVSLLTSCEWWMTNITRRGGPSLS
jgi:hypothetical protein